MTSVRNRIQQNDVRHDALLNSSTQAILSATQLRSNLNATEDRSVESSRDHRIPDLLEILCRWMFGFPGEVGHELFEKNQFRPESIPVVRFENFELAAFDVDIEK